jgi:CBS domain-containing protein
MLKASEFMTHTLATCSPDENLSNVASIMRSRDIGNVLVVENGTLKGIITDRDLALNALTDGGDPQHAPVSKYMSTKIVTGEADWSASKVAKVMAKNKIRRLPIVQDKQLVGIISLGDLARMKGRRLMVANSLKTISTPEGISTNGHSDHRGAWIGLSLLALSSTVMAWFTWNRNGQDLRKQIGKSDIYHSARQSINAARNRVDEAASSKRMRTMRSQIRSNMKSISESLPTIDYKPPKRRHVWFS